MPAAAEDKVERVVDKVFLGLWVAPHLRERLRARARRQGRKISAVVQRLLEEEFGD